MRSRWTPIASSMAIMDDECIALLLEHDTWYVPTLAISHVTASQATNPFEATWVADRGLSHALCCRAEAASDVHATWFRKALDAGVRMACFCDRELPQASAQPRGKPGFRTLDSSSGRETGSQLEESGFEPSVPLLPV